jgi:ornithine--oxo-acid transaminase
VVIAEAEGPWVTDVDGRRFLDCLAAYSAVNFGHRHPALVDATIKQLGRLTLTSRAFYSEPLGPFVEDLARLCGKNMVLPMNTGAEAVETAIKTARKWGYEVKGVPDGQAKIIVMSGNFHGRTTTIISFSDDPDARRHYSPYTPGFVTVPFGDADAIAAEIDDNTVAVLLEPIQGEAGVIIPPEGFLREVRELCTRHNVLMIADEIQSGLGRAGETFACDREGVVPDIYCLGKALGGGIMPLSAVVADSDILGVFTPGTHGSTFGGNPLAAAVSRAAMIVLVDEKLVERSAELGKYFLEQLAEIPSKHVKEVRGRGLLIAVELKPEAGGARRFCEALEKEGVLAKETHETVIRFAPPLIIDKETIDWALERIRKVLTME